MDEKYATAVPGLYQRLDYLDQEEPWRSEAKASIFRHLKANSITDHKGRRTLMSLPRHEFDPWMKTLVEKIETDFGLKPDTLLQCFVNYFQHGQSVIPHVDGAYRGPDIIIVSLGDTGHLKIEPDHVTIECPSRSVMRFTGYVRSIPTHEVLPLEGQERFSVCFTNR